MSLSDTPAAVAVIEPVAAGGPERPYVDWPAIFAGTAFAVAISFVFLAFGSALGLSLTSPYEGESTSLWGISIAAGLWFLWVQLSGFMGGAYITGRLRRRLHDASEDESDFRDGAHGLLVWAVGILVGALIAASTLGATATLAVNAASGVASGIGSAAGGVASVAGEAADQPGIASALDRLFRRAEGAAADLPEITQGERNEIGRIISSSIQEGTFAEEDRNYVASVIARTSGVEQEEARTRIDQAVASVEQAVQTARDAAETARRTALVLAFFTAASLAVSAAAAFFAAGLGGRHRDEGVALEWTRFR